MPRACGSTADHCSAGTSAGRGRISGTIGLFDLSSGASSGNCFCGRGSCCCIPWFCIVGSSMMMGVFCFVLGGAEGQFVQVTVLSEERSFSSNKKNASLGAVRQCGMGLGTSFRVRNHQVKSTWKMEHVAKSFVFVLQRRNSTHVTFLTFHCLQLQ